MPAMLDPGASRPRPRMRQGRQPDEVEGPDLQRRAVVAGEGDAERQQAVDDEERQRGDDDARDRADRQALDEGQVVGSQFANAGEVFPPFVSTQYEAGVKVDWGRFTTTASLFQITQPFTITNVAANTLVLGGQQTNQGLELNVFGEPLQDVRLLGGAMFMNPVLTQTQGGTTNGWIAPFSPQFSLNLSGEWDLPFVPGLTLNGRVIYTGSQYVDTTFPRRSLPEWTRFDLGAHYAFENPGAKGKLLVARFNVENVLDADYWQGGNVVTQLFLGQPRTFRLSLTVDF